MLSAQLLSCIRACGTPFLLIMVKYPVRSAPRAQHLALTRAKPRNICGLVATRAARYTKWGTARHKSTRKRRVNVLSCLRSKRSVQASLWSGGLQLLNCADGLRVIADGSLD